MIYSFLFLFVKDNGFDEERMGIYYSKWATFHTWLDTLYLNVCRQICLPVISRYLITILSVKLKLMGV